MNKNGVNIDPIKVFISYIDNKARIAPPGHDGPTRTAYVCGMCYSEDSFTRVQKTFRKSYRICGVCGAKNISGELVR